MKYLFSFVLLVVLPQLMFAWGPNGHRVVAKICYDNLAPDARTMVDNALGDDYLEQVSNWPDYIKSEKGWDFAKPWHFMTVHGDQTVAEAMMQSEKTTKIDNVIEGIELMKDILQGDQKAIDLFQGLMDKNKVKPLAGSIKATAFAFLIHFIGDIHQPMHCGKNRDLGGNKIKVLFFDKEANVHSVWDTHIVEKEHLSYTEFARFVEKHCHKMKATCESDGIYTWAEESIELREEIYDTLYNYTDRETGLPDFSYQYQHDFLPKVEERLAAAGYRAAKMINSLNN